MRYPHLPRMICWLALLATLTGCGALQALPEQIARQAATRGLIHELPTDVAWRVVAALDAGDTTRVQALCDAGMPQAAQVIAALARRWPRGALSQRGSFFSVGPHQSMSYTAPPPDGIVVHVPIRAVTAQATVRADLWLRRTDEGWRIVMIG